MESIVLYEVTDGEARLLYLLFPHLAGLDLDTVEDRGGSVRITARTRPGPMACRECGTPTARIHDRYRRRLKDLACGGRPIQVELQVRRLICDNPGCGVATFAEQVEGLTSRRQRRTSPLRGVLERVALALAGRAGARLAGMLGMIVSRCTLIRLIRALPDPEIGQVGVLGVDDFAKRRGHSYASLLVDMDSHRLVDLLPDREADTFAAWLRAHPGVRIVCRDRAGAFAAGARDGAPEAIQVADRFHLWQNLGEAVEKTVIAHRADLPEPASASETDVEPEPEFAPHDPDEADPAPQPPPPNIEQASIEATADNTDGFHDVHGRDRRLVARHAERYQAIQDLLAQDCSLSEISRRLQLGRDTVRRFARATTLEEVLFKATHRTTALDSFKPHLNRRWNDGVTNATALHAEIQAHGWTGSIQAVRRYLRQFRGDTPVPVRPDPAHARPAPITPAPPKPRRVVRWLMTHPDHLNSADAEHLERILARSPGLAATAQHIRSFATMMTELAGHQLDAWLIAVRADQLPALHTFANGLQRDHDAVRNGLSLPYSSGTVEGRVCKIKFLKRLMFGRANYDLLRAMALHN